jgi:LEA14-like dessication related protein
MSLRREAAATLIAVHLLAACAGNAPAVRSPEVRLDGVEVTSLSLSKQTFTLSFDVSNPNPFPLPVRAVRYHVMLEQQRFAGGETAGRFTIPAGGDGAFAISVELDLMKSAARLASIIGSGVTRPIEYELHGSLEVAVPFSRPLNFSSSGTVLVQRDKF